MGNWKRNHLIAAPFFILLITLYLSQWGGRDLSVEYVASTVDLGALIYGAAISTLEATSIMFYALAKYLEDRERRIKQRRDEGRAAVAAEWRAASRDGETAEDFLERLDRGVNGQGK